MALNDGRKSNWIDVVFDVYVENSIKNSERSLWGEETGFEVKDITIKYSESEAVEKHPNTNKQQNLSYLIHRT